MGSVPNCLKEIPTHHAIRWFKCKLKPPKKDVYPLPLIKQCLDSLMGMVFMSTLDMNSGYWQLLLAIADHCKTAFQTKDGLFEFLGMLFGLCNAPATFQCAIQLVFRGMTWKEVLTYLNDINILGTGFEGHLKNLYKVFEHLQENNLKLKPRKCKFFQTEVPFLGKLVTRDGQAVNPRKIEVVVLWSVPKSTRDVESFLGFVNYHRHHIKDYANLAAPLYHVMGKELLALVHFTLEYHHYLFGRKFTVHTDHSSLAWLMRFCHPQGMLACWLEELSQYDMVIQHCPGVKHGNADGLSHHPDPLPYCDCYEAGATLESLPCGGCDFCSSLHNQWAHFEVDVDDVVPLAVQKVLLGDETDWDEIISSEYTDQPQDAIWLPSYPPEELWKFQLDDPDLSQLIGWLESDSTPLLADLYYLCSPSVTKFWLSKSQLEFQKGVLFYRWEGEPFQYLLLVPDALKEEVLLGCHDCPMSSHLGQKKTLDQVKR